MTERTTWFEVEVPYPLAALLQQVTNAWMHSGVARRNDIADQVTAVLTRPRRAGETAEAHDLPGLVPLERP